MADILVNHVRLHYIEFGGGPTIILLHGLFGNLETWTETSSYFKQRFRVIAYDARGHGQSEIPDNQDAYSQDIMVQDLKGLMDSLGITQTILVGHSMGAGVALNFYLQYPERCLGLVLVSIGSGCSNPQWWQKWWNRLSDLADRKGMASVLKEMRKLTAWRDALTDSKIGNQVSETILQNSPKAIAYTIRGIQKKRPPIFQLESILKESQINTLVVISEFDTPVAECSRFIADCMPRATLHVLPARSHWTHLETSEEFLSVVDKFVTLLASG